MGEVIYLPARRPRGLQRAYALMDVEYLLDLCREVELRARWPSREQGISIGERLDPELIARLESLVRSHHRKS